MKKSEGKSAPKRSDIIIPDYDYLFNEDAQESKRKKGFFKKILRINKKPIIASSFLLILQNLQNLVKKALL